MSSEKRGKPAQLERIGGFTFFCSLLAFFCLTISNLIALPSLLTSALNITVAASFAAALFVGILFAKFCLTRHSKVLIHELKHSILSGLVGNKWRGMKIKSRSGHFEYAYSERTARFNALIALAPYCLPLITFVAILIAVATSYQNPLRMALIIGFAYGCDLLLQWRDVSPHQSDLTVIAGGYSVAVAYVMFANLFVASCLAAWALAGVPGLLHLGQSFWGLCLAALAASR